ncbi:hypothetical protein QYF61_000078 [Mycteria americana]|uniref:Uncharacterized protein n=1 Tax=Mycteria americana TaxID=33587 RepID=A0AAN7NPI0_MYCAM|nr:hypothetical protein QYF61_000078 [Mycteria americana]
MSINWGEFNRGPWRRSRDCSTCPVRRSWGAGLVQPGEKDLVGPNSSFPIPTRRLSRTWNQAFGSGAWWKDKKLRDVQQASALVTPPAWLLEPSRGLCRRLVDRAAASQIAGSASSNPVLW